MKYLLLFAFSIFLFSCAASKNKTKQSADKPIDAVITMDKTPCYGTCPVYSITIHGDGKAIYTGKRFVDKIGKYEKQFSQAEIRQVLKVFEEAKFFDFQNEYTAHVSDMPTTYLILTEQGKTKKVRDYYNAPSALKQLEKIVEDMANSDGWKKIEEGN